jgi:hypothetical protein
MQYLVDSIERMNGLLKDQEFNPQGRNDYRVRHLIERTGNSARQTRKKFPRLKEAINLVCKSWDKQGIRYESCTKSIEPVLILDPKAPSGIRIENSKTSLSVGLEGTHPLNRFAKFAAKKFGINTSYFDPLYLSQNNAGAMLQTIGMNSELYLPNSVSYDFRTDLLQREELVHELYHAQTVLDPKCKPCERSKFHFTTPESELASIDNMYLISGFSFDELKCYSFPELDDHGIKGLHEKSDELLFKNYDAVELAFQAAAILIDLRKQFHNELTIPSVEQTKSGVWIAEFEFLSSLLNEQGELTPTIVQLIIPLGKFNKDIAVVNEIDSALAYLIEYARSTLQFCSITGSNLIDEYYNNFINHFINEKFSNTEFSKFLKDCFAISKGFPIDLNEFENTISILMASDNKNLKELLFQKLVILELDDLLTKYAKDFINDSYAPQTFLLALQNIDVNKFNKKKLLKTVQKIRRKFPKDWRIRALESELYLNSGNTSRALNSITRAIDIASKQSVNSGVDSFELKQLLENYSLILEKSGLMGATNHTKELIEEFFQDQDL